MTYSMLPGVDDILSFRRTARPRAFARENAVAVTVENGSQILDRSLSEKRLSLENRKVSTWLAVLFLSTLVVILYASVLGSLARQWWNDPNYSHGFFVPLFAAYILWRERGRWGAQQSCANNSGLAIILGAIGLLVLGTLAAEIFTSRVSLLILICGMIVFLAGYKTLRSMAFPIGYLIFMIPLPAIIYYQLTFPLQLLASRMGANGLVALGVPTVREGNLLILPNCTLEVVEACSGVRSLLSLLAAVVGYVYLAEPRIWKRCVLIASTIPIVIVSNGFRLVATGLLSFFFGPGADSGLAHTGLG